MDKGKKKISPSPSLQPTDFGQIVCGYTTASEPTPINLMPLKATCKNDPPSDRVAYKNIEGSGRQTLNINSSSSSDSPRNLSPSRSCTKITSIYDVQDIETG